VERFARRWWGGELGTLGRALSVATAPASWIWSAVHRARARTPRRIAGVRIVSVGNLAVGGTGKTPIVRWMASELHARGVATCILVGTAASDEAELHSQWNPAIPVLVDRDRAASAERARALGARALVLDDGFQHTEIGRDLDVVVMSADDPFPGHVLPRGPYREAASALGRASAVLVTRRAAKAESALALARTLERAWPGRLAGVLTLAPGHLVRWDGSPAEPPGGGLLAACAVARPEAFADAVREMTGAQVELAAFPDHHPFDRRDALRLRRSAGARTIVLTEKDAVKLVTWKDELGDTLVLQDDLHWDRGEDDVRSRLLDAVLGTEAA
jgi:tetraacyldisaccharide 4'-kinase